MADFEADLVFEVFGVVEGGFVEDEDVRETCEDVVYYEAEDPDVVKLAMMEGNRGVLRTR